MTRMKAPLLFLTAVALSPAVACAAPAQQRPNVVVILVDDMGYADVGFNGCKDIPTPRIDSLARDGVRCTSGYAAHPFCSPTRAALMTGRYQHRFGHENNPKYDPADEVAGLPVSQSTIADALRAAGYVTGAIGKWHLGAAPKFHPLRRGFSENYGFLGGGHDYFQVQMDGEPKEYLIPMDRSGKKEPLEGYLTDALSAEAAAFVRRHAQEPFFLYLAYNAPHAPLQAPEKYLARFAAIADEKRRTYAAMVSAVDDGVGLLLDALKELGLYDRTLLFFLSDNGGPVGVRSNGSDNTPLREGKGSVFEGGIRVPFAVTWKGRIRGGRDYARPVSCIDILPTALAAAGGAPPAGTALDGVSLLPFLEGTASGDPHAALFWRTSGGKAHAIRAGNLKLAVPESGPALFDLTDDTGETKPLAADPRQADLESRYTQWNDRNVAPLFESPKQVVRPKGKNRP